MRMGPARLVITILLAVLAGAAAHGARPAGQAVDHDEALRLRQSGAIVPFATILDRAVARYPGSRLLQTGLQRDDDALIYDVDLLTADGRVRILRIDARNGRVLGDQDERDH